MALFHLIVLTSTQSSKTQLDDECRWDYHALTIEPLGGPDESG